MFILRPSSPFKTSRIIAATPTDESAADLSASAVAAPEAKTDAQKDLKKDIDAEPFIDLGLPVPDTYNTDILRAMIQDPFRVFLYWEVREDNLKALTAYFSPEDVKGFSTVLKLRDLTGGHEAYFPVGKRGRYWMMVFPDRDYEFEIGVRSPAHGYISLLRSNPVHTPRGTVSPVTADEVEYQLEPMEFIEVMEKSGFGAGQSADIVVAAFPGAGVDEDFLEDTLDKLPDSVREAMQTALSGGSLTSEMIDGLPESVRGQLSGLLRESGGEVASVGLMHYLPELLRETIEDEREWVADQAHPVHLSPRFFVGASEMGQFPFGELTAPKLASRSASRPARRARPSSSDHHQQPNASSGPSLRRLLEDR